ncbi:TPA: helix-turn-helix domain-containing protein [Klebsiella pneumoniae]
MTTYNDQFIKMPLRILSISHINGIKFSDNSKTLYCYLKGFDKAFPSYSKIGEVFGISARAAEERVKKLVELGLVIKTRRFSSSNLYEVLEIPGQEESNEVGQTPDMPEIVDSFFFDDTEEKQQPIPETDPMCEFDDTPEEEAPAPKPKPAKKPATISTKEIQIEPVNLNFLGVYRQEWESPDKNLPVSQHPKIRWLLINGYLDTEKNPKLKTIYEEIKHLC